MSLFGRWGRRNAESATGVEPRATGPTREVAEVIGVDPRRSATDVLTFPVAGAHAGGALVHATAGGPSGSAPATSPAPSGTHCAA